MSMAMSVTGRMKSHEESCSWFDRTKAEVKMFFRITPLPNESKLAHVVKKIARLFFLAIAKLGDIGGYALLGIGTTVGIIAGGIAAVPFGVVSLFFYWMAEKKALSKATIGAPGKPLNVVELDKHLENLSRNKRHIQTINIVHEGKASVPLNSKVKNAIEVCKPREVYLKGISIDTSLLQGLDEIDYVYKTDKGKNDEGILRHHPRVSPKLIASSEADLLQQLNDIIKEDKRVHTLSIRYTSDELMKITPPLIDTLKVLRPKQLALTGFETGPEITQVSTIQTLQYKVK